MPFVTGNEEQVLLLSPLLVKQLMEMTRVKVRDLYGVNQREMMFFFPCKDRVQKWAIHIAERGLIPTFVGVSLF